MDMMTEGEHSPPPVYKESSSPVAHNDNTTTTKDGEYFGSGQNAWLVRRTSIHIETTSIDQSEDRSSLHGSAASTHAASSHKPSRPGLFGRGSTRHDSHDARGSGSIRHLGSPFEKGAQLGTQVFIEATRPMRQANEKRIELKGLQEAASAKRWNGMGGPPEAWGKLMKDPELWDDEGDTYVYYGYQRPSPAFRVKSSVLQETKSDELMSQLQEGHRKEPPPVHPSPHAAAQGTNISSGMRGLSLSSKSRTANPSSTNKSMVPVRYEIYFPAPSSATRLDILRHHITTRNLLALLFNKPLVGLTFYQALVDLQERCEDLMPSCNSAQLIIRLLTNLNLYNVSNDPAAACGLLAWSEDNFWLDGWREAFVHSCGMHSRARQMPEFRDISHDTRALLESSGNEVLSKLREAEDRLATFNFEDIWPPRAEVGQANPAGFLSFKTFLLKHFEKKYKTWPPRPPGIVVDGKVQATSYYQSWLTRDCLQQLCNDFAALYSLLVDFDVDWDKDSKSYLVRKNDNAPDAPVRLQNGDEIAIERIVFAFDSKQCMPHVPHACPLFPARAGSTLNSGKSNTNNGNNHDSIPRPSLSSSLFSSRSKNSNKKTGTGTGPGCHEEATNSLLLSGEIMSNPLVEAYLKFDKSDRCGDPDARSVRKARWVLLYGIIQVLSHINVVAPHLAFHNHKTVQYPLNPRLVGMPPWQPDGGLFVEPGALELYSWLESSKA